MDKVTAVRKCEEGRENLAEDVRNNLRVMVDEGCKDGFGSMCGGIWTSNLLDDGGATEGFRAGDLGCQELSS